MAKRVHLDEERQLDLLDRTQANEAIEDRLPIFVPCKIVVGDEEVVQPLRHVRAHDRLDVVGRTAARFSTLDIDDGAERTLERTAASRVKAGDAAGGACSAHSSDNRDGRPFDAGQIRHVVVERLKFFLEGILQHLLKTPFRFTGKKRDAHRLGAMEIGIVAAEHAHRPGDMETADPDLNAALAQRLREVERVRELIRLHADHHHHARAGLFDHARQALRTDAGVRLVKRMDLQFDIIAEDVALGAIASQAKDCRQRIGRNRGTKPLDHVAVVVIVRRLDENEAKTLHSARGCSRGRHHGFQTPHHTQCSDPRQAKLPRPSSPPPRSQTLFGNALIFATQLRSSLSPGINTHRRNSARQPFMRRRIAPVLRRCHQSALHGIVVQIFKFLQHHLIARDGLWMNAFLPDLMSALALVSRAEEFQLIQQPIATFKLKLTENLVSREFLEVRHSAR